MLPRFRRQPEPLRPLARELIVAVAMAGIGAVITAAVFLFYSEPQRVSEWSARAAMNHELLQLLKQRLDQIELQIRTHQHPREN